MAKKYINWKTKGMNRDMSVSAFNPEFAFENLNIRLSTNEGNTMMSWVNEKGTKELELYIPEPNSGTASYSSMEGIPIGTAVLNHKLVVFTCPGNIYVFKKADDDNYDLKGKILYRGDLGFNPEYPLETLVSYESENVQKVYWTDNLNQPRVINIVGDIQTDNSHQFDFVPELQLNEKITVTKMFGTGEFPPGVIQYAFTYYNKYGQESNVFYTTPLQYISYVDRGGAPDSKIANAFKIAVTGMDRNFDYLRIYSILRTSLNATPLVKRIQDIEVNSDTVSFIDTGLQGDTIDPTELLYKGGEEIIAKTMEQKDGTLFLGNIRSKRPSISDEIKNSLNTDFSTQTSDTDKALSSVNAELGCILSKFKGNVITKGDLAYVNSISISGFKNREVYRIGIAFQYKTGKWSEPIWLRDYKIDASPSINESTGELQVPQIKVTISNSEIIKDLLDAGYKKARLLIAQPSMSDRTIICQGIANPCLYQADRRYTLSSDGTPDQSKFGSLYGQSSWIFRPKGSSLTDTTAMDGGGFISSDQVNDIRSMEPINLGSLKQYASPGLRSIEIGANLNYGSFQVDPYLMTFHSPEITFDESLYSKDWSNIVVESIGEAKFSLTFGDIDIQTSTPTIGSAQGFIHKSVRTDGNAALVSGLYYEDFIVDDLDNTPKYGRYDKMHIPVSFPVFLWHKNGSLNNDVSRDRSSAQLLKKKISNYHMANSVTYSNIKKLDSLDVKLFSSENLVIEKLYGHPYMANVDTMVTPSTPTYKYFVGDPWRTEKDTNMLSNSYYRLGLQKPGDTSTRNGIWKLTFGSSIVDTSWANDGRQDKDIGDNVPDLCETSEPISIKYKSTPHLVVMVDNVSSNNTFMGIDISALPILELRMEYDKAALYGGQTDDALKANLWIPVSTPVTITTTGITIISEWGDTYFQRYECLKTYPFTQEDKNQVVDIASFVCETHVNIDGRYDRNRAQTSNLNMTPQNFNLLNPVYSQVDNFFSYKILDEDDYKNTTYPNTVTWTKTKQNGADVDLWTNVTLANVLEMDGDKGEVNKLVRLNNQLISFQDSGIAQILYNENTQISTTEGVPIEIANSEKVQGKRYYSDTVGCSNKWSVATTPAGIYFMDSNEKSIYLFNGQLNNISTAGGFNSFAKETILSTNENWNPECEGIYATYYDKLNQDVLFVKDDIALAYSEKFQCFTSFYTYGGAYFLESLDDMEVWIKEGTLWQHQAGDYCKFFDENQPFSMTLVANQEPQLDKIFTNLEFRACVEGEGTYDNTKKKYTPSLPFDSIEVWNEYQHGILTLDNRNSKDRFTHGTDNGILARKFRTWACDIPRDNAPLETDLGASEHIKRFKVRPLDRIRNPWAYIKLKKETTIVTMSRVEIHDIMATYFN